MSFQVTQFGVLSPQLNTVFPPFSVLKFELVPEYDQIYTHITISIKTSISGDFHLCI